MDGEEAYREFAPLVDKQGVQGEVRDQMIKDLVNLFRDHLKGQPSSLVIINFPMILGKFKQKYSS